MGMGSIIYARTPNLDVAVAGQLITALGFGTMRPVRDAILRRGRKFERMDTSASVVMVIIVVIVLIVLIVPALYSRCVSRSANAFAEGKVCCGARVRTAVKVQGDTSTP